MNTDLSLEYRILGGSAEDARQSIQRIDDPMLLEALIKHEGSHYRRKTVLKALDSRLHKVVKARVVT